ncbi:Klc [Symbiodinium sp. CCMP2592]|nr:Klc [Symbiodinium sp. CCMP2592]
MRWMLSQSLLVLAGLAKELDRFNPETVCCNIESVDGLLYCANASATAPAKSHIHVTSLATREIHGYAVFSAAINAAHAKTFGNSFQLATSSFGLGSDLKLLWRAGNVATILEALKVAPGASWIAYLDADAVVVDFSKDALADVVRAHSTKETHLMVSRGELIGPGTSSMFNSGFLLVRQHPWAHDFVQLWLSQLSSSKANDQEVLEQLYRQDALSCRRHVAILPMGLVYSEIGNPISGPPDQQHVVHLAGIPDQVRTGVFSAFWRDLCGTNTSMALPGSLGLRQAYLEEMASFVSQGDASAEMVCLSPASARQCLEAAERLAYGLQLDGRQQEAVHWAAGALSGREQHLGTLDEDTLASRSTLATVMEAGGRKEEALAFSMAAWEGRKVTYGPKHRATMLSTARLGSQLLAHNRLEEATVFLRAAQQADILGPQHPSSISAAAALALAYAKQSRYTEALALYRQTAHSAAEGLGKHHATTLELRLGVADTLRQLGQNDEAAATSARLLRAHRRALKTKALRSDQLRLARAIELVLGGRVETLPKRLKLIEEAAEVYAKLDMKSSRVSILRSGADMLQADARSSEAESWFRRALAVAEDTETEKSEKGLASAVASTANNLAMLLRSRGKGAEAEGLLRRAAQGFAKDHQAAELRALGNLADTLRANGRLSEAFKISMRVMQSHELLDSEDDVLTAKSNHALLLYALGKRTESAALYSDVLQQAERVFGAMSRQAVAARADLEELRRREAAESSGRGRASTRPGQTRSGRRNAEL